MRRAIAIVALSLIAALAPAQRPDTIVVACKNFTEQEIMGELVTQLLEQHTDLRVRRRFGLGGTEICHSALLAGSVDCYVEYTGTSLLNVLGLSAAPSADATYRIVAGAYRESFDLELLPPIGFNNTYALVVRREVAEELGIATIGDLIEHAGELRGGFTAEFMERPDGLPGLRQRHGLAFGSTSDLDPGLMYDVIGAGQVDVISAFATDGRLAELDVVVLEDDLGFFPPYDAAPVFRAGVLERHPEIRDALVALAGTIDDDEMRRLNHAVDVLGQRPAVVARAWIEQRGGAAPEDAASGKPAERLGVWSLAIRRRGEVATKLVEHLALTGVGVALAMLIGVPLGIMTHRLAPARGVILAGVEMFQTIPSLAMLAFLFAIYGMLGFLPAATALVLYALLPIVVNTFAGLRQVEPAVVDAARGMGMTSAQRLRMVELPLAAPVIIAGIRSATVLTVGIATLSTYIGAGGLGDFIARGLARNDPRLTLLGALPAAVLAIVLGLGIRGIEKLVTRA